MGGAVARATAIPLWSQRQREEIMREKVTPEMQELMQRMDSVHRELEKDAKRLEKAKDASEAADLRRRVQESSTWLTEAGGQLRRMKSADRSDPAG